MTLKDKYKALLDKYKVNNLLRLSHFFAQIKAESGLKPINENLNYSPEGLINTFGTDRISIADANKYGRTSKHAANQEMIANIVYGGKWGLKNLGNSQPGDGWKFRGRGFKQITGRSNYTKLSKDTGIDYVNNPDLLLNEADAMNSALWFWNDRKLNDLADFTGLKENPKTKKKEDAVILITRAINGGLNGLDKRRQYFNEYKKEFADEINI